MTVPALLGLGRCHGRHEVQLPLVIVPQVPWVLQAQAGADHPKVHGGSIAHHPQQAHLLQGNMEGWEGGDEGGQYGSA